VELSASGIGSRSMAMVSISCPWKSAIATIFSRSLGALGVTHLDFGRDVRTCMDKHLKCPWWMS